MRHVELSGTKGNGENTVTECTKPGGSLLRHVVSPIAMTEQLLIVKILDMARQPQATSWKARGQGSRIGRNRMPIMPLELVLLGTSLRARGVIVMMWASDIARPQNIALLPVCAAAKKTTKSEAFQGSGWLPSSSSMRDYSHRAVAAQKKTAFGGRQDLTVQLIGRGTRE
jgi:hypothetical protein